MATDGHGDRTPAIRRFATFFRAYAVGLSLVTATFPPIVGHFDIVPIFSSIKGYLTGLTSLGSYLLVAFLFSIRGTLAKGWYPGHSSHGGRVPTPRQMRRVPAFDLLPGVLILVSLAFFFIYLWAVHNAIHRVAFEYAVSISQSEKDQPLREILGENSLGVKVVHGRLPFETPGFVRISYQTGPTKAVIGYDVQFDSEATVRTLLKITPSASLPGLFMLTMPFVVAFLCAVGAFVLVGLKDYVRDVLGIDEKEAVSGRPTEPTHGSDATQKGAL